MKHSSFCKGMAKLQTKGLSKQQAFNRMKYLSNVRAEYKKLDYGDKNNQNYQAYNSKKGMKRFHTEAEANHWAGIEKTGDTQDAWVVWDRE